MIVFGKPQLSLTLLRGGIVIIQDDQAEEIVAEILKRRKDSLHNYYAHVNPFAYKSVESKRWKELKENGIVTEEEYAKALGEIAARR